MGRDDCVRGDKVDIAIFIGLVVWSRSERWKAFTHFIGIVMAKRGNEALMVFVTSRLAQNIVAADCDKYYDVFRDQLLFTPFGFERH